MLPSAAKTEVENKAKTIIITIRAAMSRLRMAESEIERISKIFLLSFPRKRESKYCYSKIGIPAFAGMTEVEVLKSKNFLLYFIIPHFYKYGYSTANKTAMR